LIYSLFFKKYDELTFIIRNGGEGLVGQGRAGQSRKE
jgi:hypothetical protein